MKLAVFDIDGTLTDTVAAEGAAFIAAAREALDLAVIDSDWNSYVHVTSEGVLGEIVQRTFGRPLTGAESRQVQRRFVDKLRPMEIREIPGAAAFLRRLADAGWAVALASGDWALSARHKLAAARIPADGLPAAFCDSAVARVDIMRHSLRRAQTHYRCTAFEQVVYVGDGGWDVRACRELGWGFVGIEPVSPPPKLRHLGATQVFSDFRDAEGVLSALASAQPPR